MMDSLCNHTDFLSEGIITKEFSVHIAMEFSVISRPLLPCRAETKALIGGVYIHIFTFCPTNFF